VSPNAYSAPEVGSASAQPACGTNTFDRPQTTTVVLDHGFMRIAFVVQRYGQQVNGGAEQHCRDIAERLAARNDVERVKVFTTCARDHTTWANYFPRGMSIERGVQVERFPVLTQRNQALQSIFGRLALRGPRLTSFEAPWLIAQGPFVPELPLRLNAARKRFDVFVFFSYLYYPTIFGLPRVAERSMFVPTAHDELPLRLSRALRLFNQTRAIAFNTREEKQLVESRVDISGTRADIVGCGVDTDPPDVEAERRNKPYLLYLGRIETAKGVPELIRGFRAFRRGCADRSIHTRLGPQRLGRDLELVLAGRGGDMKSDGAKDVHWAGFVSDQRRVALLRGCEAVVIPGKLDSLSLSLLEAWALSTPTLATSECAVKRGHSQRSGAGLLFGPEAPLEDVLEKLLCVPGWYAGAAEAGERYVRDNYAWSSVMDRFMAVARYVAKGSESAQGYERDEHGHDDG